MDYMQINVKGTNIELTEAIKDYVLKKVTNLGKLLTRIEDAQGKVMVSFDVGKSTNHHKGGDVFHADCKINIDGKEFYGSADKEDLYQAIDAVKESLYNEINKNKDRTQTLMKRGASKMKRMLKGGFDRINPF